MAKQEATLILRVKQIGGKAIDGLKKGFSQLKTIGVGAFTAISGVIAAGIVAYKEQEKSVNKLNQTLAQQGIYTKDLSSEYQNMASELQKVTTFGDEAIISAQSQLQAYLGTTKVTKELTKATLDFAAAQGVDLKSAADLIGKSIGSQTNALTRYGVSLDANLTKSEKLAQVTDKLNQRFGGQAEAVAKGLGGLDQMKNSIGDAFEIIGKKFAPSIAAVAKLIRNFADDVAAGKVSLDGLISVGDFVIKTFLYLKTAVATFAASVGIGLAGAIETVNRAIQGQFSQAADIAKESLKEVKQTYVDNKKDLNAQLEALDQEKANREEERRQEEMRLLQQAKESRVTLLQQEAAEEKKIQDKRAADQKKRQEELTKKAEEQARIREANQANTLSRISGLTQSNDKRLQRIGKAATIAQIAIETPKAIATALASAPPPFNFVLAGLVGVAMAEQATRAAALEDGGIVRATAGGTHAIIGEGNRDEAVVPLDSFGGGIGGNQISINVNGAMTGDRETARQFAGWVDEELLRLRKDNASVAFDERVR